MKKVASVNLPNPHYKAITLLYSQAYILNLIDGLHLRRKGELYRPKDKLYLRLKDDLRSTSQR